MVTDGIPDVSKGNPFTWSTTSNWGNYLPFENVDEAAADICIATAHNSWLATPGPFTCASGNAKYDQCVTDPEGSFSTMYQAIKDCFEAEFASQLLQTSQTATTQGKAKVGCSAAGATGTVTPGCQDNDHTTDTLDPGCSDQWNCDCLFTMRVWGEDPCNGNHICPAWKAINCPGEQTKLLENNSTEPGQKADDLLSLMSDLEATRQSDGARVGWYLTCHDELCLHIEVRALQGLRLSVRKLLRCLFNEAACPKHLVNKQVGPFLFDPFLWWLVHVTDQAYQI